jgi:hypothetical protein
MDDLFLATFRRRAEGALTHQAQAFEPDRSLRALWAMSDDRTSSVLTMEFAALANHRKSIRTEIARYAELFRSRQTEILGHLMAELGIDTESLPPVAIMVLITGVSQILVMEEALGMSAGHAETRALVERWITQLEGGPRSSDPPTPKRRAAKER